MNAPRVLMLTLKIFGFENETLQSLKFLIENIKINKFVEVKVGSDAVLYQLKASVVHFGVGRGNGHYFAVTKHGESWKKISDTSVKAFSLQHSKSK